MMFMMEHLKIMLVVTYNDDVYDGAPDDNVSGDNGGVYDGAPSVQRPPNVEGGRGGGEGGRQGGDRGAVEQDDDDEHFDDLDDLDDSWIKKMTLMTGGAPVEQPC